MDRKQDLQGKTLLSILEAGKYIGVGESALDRYRKEVDFPRPVMVYGRAYFKRAELDEWAEKYRRNGDIFDKEALSRLELLSNEETLFYTGISDTTRIRHKTKGTFPKEVRRYGEIYYRRIELDEWLAGYERSKPIRRPEQ